jgi:hypothetical protein
MAICMNCKTILSTPQVSMPCPVCGSLDRIRFGVEGAGATETATVKPWMMRSFAPGWYADALAQARRPAGPGTTGYHDARRREIVFAACCAESYLFEWVRDGPLYGLWEKLEEHFPTKGKDGRSLQEKWEQIPSALLATKLETGGDHGEDFERLIYFRNGLVHALSSRPETDDQLKRNKPRPSVRELDEMQPGWAVGVVAERIKRLHNAAHTQPPDWLVEPISDPA